MGAIRVILAARLRCYWRAWLLLAVLVAVGTAVVLAAITAGRRADSAFPWFVAAHGYDAIVYTEKPLPLATLPDVTQAVETRAPFVYQPTCSCGKRIDYSDLAVREVPPAALPRMVKLLSGRMPDQSDPLKALGFVRPQLAGMVFWQAVAVDVVGLAAGVPLGMVLGRAVWRVFAGNLGVVPFTVYPGWLLAAIAGGFLVATLTIAVIPARAAARARTSQLLRAE